MTTTTKSSRSLGKIDWAVGLFTLLIVLSSGPGYCAPNEYVEFRRQPIPTHHDFLPWGLAYQPDQYTVLGTIGYRHMTAISKFDDLNQHALVMTAPRSWRHESANGRLLESTLSFAAGLMMQDDAVHMFLSVGPVLRWTSESSRFSAEVGLSPTLMEDSMFAERELGGRLHFTSHIASVFSFGRQRQHRIALRLQHISNGGLSSTNPGVDMFGIEYRWRTYFRTDNP